MLIKDSQLKDYSKLTAEKLLILVQNMAKINQVFFNRREELDKFLEKNIKKNLSAEKILTKIDEIDRNHPIILGDIHET